MHVYTRTGDKGETGLFGGSRIGKDSLKVNCYGTIDEANSFLGLAYSTSDNKELKEKIRWIQTKLFIVAAELASDDQGKEMLKSKVSKEEIAILENIIDDYLKIVGEQNFFIIPGDSQVSSMLHIARTIIRRAERNIVELNREEKLREELIGFVNRLSDAIYVMARYEGEYLSKI